MALSLTTGMLFRVAVMRTEPLNGSAELIVSVLPDLETFTLRSELEKSYSDRTPLVSVKVSVYFPSLYSSSLEEPFIKLGTVLCLVSMDTI